MTEEEVKRLLETSFPESLIQVFDMTGGGESFDIRIASPRFEGKTRLQQHQLVYAALGDKMKSELHAVKLQTMSS